MSNLNFQVAGAEINKLAFDKKGKEAEKVCIMRLVLSCQVPGEAIKSLTTMTEDMPNYWDKKGDPLNIGISSMTSIGICEAHTIKLGELTFEDVELKEFHIRPIADNQALIEFKTNINQPTDKQTTVMTHYLKETMALEVISPQQDLVDD